MPPMDSEDRNLTNIAWLLCRCVNYVYKTVRQPYKLSEPDMYVKPYDLTNHVFVNCKPTNDGSATGSHLWAN